MSISAHSTRVDFFREPENGRKHQSPIVFVIVLKSAALYLSVSDRQVRPAALPTPSQMQEKLDRYEDLLFLLFSEISQRLPTTCFHIMKKRCCESSGMNNSNFQRSVSAVVRGVA